MLNDVWIALDGESSRKICDHSAGGTQEHGYRFYNRRVTAGDKLENVGKPTTQKLANSECSCADQTCGCSDLSWVYAGCFSCQPCLV
jgi:hypothetical protein